MHSHPRIAPHLMTKLLSRGLLCLGLLACTGCDLLGMGNGNCPGTMGSRYGCVRVVVVIDAPPKPWPQRYIFSLVSVPLREGTGMHQEIGASPNTGENRLHLARHDPPYRGMGDTASVWIAASIVDSSNPQVGTRAPVFAVDSALYLVDFNRSRIDTVRLTLRRP